MIRHILFSYYEAFKLREFMIRAEKHLPVKFDLFISAVDEGAFPVGMSEEEMNSHMRYTEGYKKVIQELGLEDRCSSINFYTNEAPSHIIDGLLSNHGPDDLVCFLTTDEMLISDVDERLIEEQFKEKMLFSFSLRLGKNIVKNSMVGMNNKVVPIYDDGTIMRWDWDKHYVDFSGPLSVHGHYFRTKEVYRMLKKIGRYSSYDDLEDGLQAFMNFPKKLMASFVESKAVSIDPLIHGSASHDIRLIGNTRLLNNDPIPINIDSPQEEIHFNPFKEIMKEMNKWQRQHILFKFPVRGRREKLFAALNAYLTNMVNQEDFEFLISIDEDDDALNNDEVKAAITTLSDNISIQVGPSKGKIDAINRDMEKAKPWDIVVLVSDDMIPKLRGFDMIIRKDMHRNFPDTDGVLWYNDGHQGDRLNTLCILGKTYYDRFGYIYQKDYISLYCDNEFTEVSKLLGKVKYNSLCIIEHQHWAWGYGVMDEIYQRNELTIDHDRKVFERRLSESFGLVNNLN